jgi:proteasome-associated ATPase
VIILASNRADLIDPAILRPGRIDRKIKVNRPDKEGAHEIFKIYLTPDLPYDPALVKETGSTGATLEKLVDGLIETIFARKDENKFLSITLRSGKKETLYRGDLISGAIIASIVERAKGSAIKRAIAGIGGETEVGISEADLRLAFDAEYAANDIFPPSDITEDWLHLIDYDSENVVKVAPIRAGGERVPTATSVI